MAPYLKGRYRVRAYTHPLSSLILITILVLLSYTEQYKIIDGSLFQHLNSSPHAAWLRTQNVGCSYSLVLRPSLSFSRL